MSYAKFSALVVKAACQEYFKRIEDEVNTANLAKRELLLSAPLTWRKRIAEKMIPQATIDRTRRLRNLVEYSMDDALSDAFYGNRQVRQLAALAQAAVENNVFVEVSAEDAALIFPNPNHDKD